MLLKVVAILWIIIRVFKNLKRIRALEQSILGKYKNTILKILILGIVFVYQEQSYESENKVIEQKWKSYIKRNNVAHLLKRTTFRMRNNNHHINYYRGNQKEHFI